MPRTRGHESHGTSTSGRPYWSQVLRALRETRGVTQEGWATLLGVGRSTVQRWEAGQAAPDAFAEAAILAYCRDYGLLRPFERGPLQGLALTEALLRDTLGEARLGSSVRSLRPGVSGDHLHPALGPPNAMAGARAPVVIDEEAFVGRAAELQRLRAAFDMAVDGRGSVAMLAGEPGVGKTRTVQELESYAAAYGARVLWGRSYEAGGAPPYWPWVQVGNAWGAAVDLLGSGASRLGRARGDLGELSRVFPELRRAPGFIEPAEVADPRVAQFRLFEVFSRFMREQTADEPWLVVLDDLHWADKPTLDLLVFVARELPQMRVLVVGTFRDQELARTEPLVEALFELSRSGGFQRFNLVGLTREEVGDYIWRSTGIAAPVALTDRVFAATSGSPFFVREVVNLLAENGMLQGTADVEIALPDGVRVALDRRLARLSEEALDVLRYAAIAGGQFAYATLREVTGLGSEALLPLIEQGLRGHVIEEAERPGRYRFVHGLMLETVVAEVSKVRQARMHGEIGEALERRRSEREPQPAARLAHHFSEAAAFDGAHVPKAVHYAIEAGHQAEAVAAWGEAARWYQRAVAVSDDAGDSLTPGSRGEILAALGRCAWYAGDAHTAVPGLRAAIDALRVAGRSGDSIRATLELLRIPNRAARRVAWADVALADLRDVEPRLEALLIIARLRMRRLDSASAGRLTSRLAAILVEHQYEDVRASSLLLSIDQAFYDGRPDLMIAAADDAYRELLAVGDRLHAAEALHARAVAQSQLGNLDACLRSYQSLSAFAGRLGLGVLAGFGDHGQAGIAFARLDGPRLEAALNATPKDNFTSALFRSAVAEQSGDATRAMAFPPTKAARGVAAYEVVLRACRARVLHSFGRIDDAHREIRAWSSALAAAEGSVDARVSVDAAIALVDEALADLGTTTEVDAAYKTIAAHPLVRFAAESRSLDRVRGALALRLGLLDVAESHFQAGLAWAERERCPVEEGRGLLGLARVARRRGDKLRAVISGERALGIFVAHGAGLYAAAARIEIDAAG